MSSLMSVGVPWKYASVFAWDSISLFPLEKSSPPLWSHLVCAWLSKGVSVTLARKLQFELLYFFRHFDKDKTGYLDHQEFKSCLRSLGYDLSIVEEGEEDPEFQAILRTVDPNG